MKYSWMAIPLMLMPIGAVAQHSSSGGGHGGHAARGYPGRGAYQPTAIVPVPVYVGGVGYGGYYSTPYADPQPGAYGVQQGPPPSVLVNPGYQQQVQNPVVYDYSNVQLPESVPLEQRQSAPPPEVIQQQSDPSPTIYLIAMTDGNIVAALGFWLEGDTLNYITRDGNRNRVSIDRVDRPFSVKLNADRNLDFKL
jgi:hypothetical protein